MRAFCEIQRGSFDALRLLRTCAALRLALKWITTVFVQNLKRSIGRGYGKKGQENVTVLVVSIDK